MAVITLVVDYVWATQYRGQHGLKPVFLCAIAAAFVIVHFVTTREALLSRSRRGFVTLVGSVALLSLYLQFGTARTFRAHFAEALAGLPFTPIHGFLYFAACSLLLRMALPLLVANRVLGLDPAALGFRLRATPAQRWLFVAVLGVMIPTVLYLSADAGFQRKYPQAGGVVVGGELSYPLFIAYQMAYLLVFVSGESFWRGFMLFGLEKELGWLSLTFMSSLYSVAHFGKPLPEAWGAIVAGYVLGYIALRYRDFWFGVAVHWSIALTMDLAVLWRRGLL